MTFRRWIRILAPVSLAAAGLAVYTFSDSQSPDERETPAAPIASPAAAAPRSAPPSIAAAAAAAAKAPEDQQADAGSPPIQPPGSVAEFENPDDRAASLQEMQRQRFQSAMQALNRRAARRAALASPTPAER
jgi:hypothetical protein